ncbi:hypothetical protein [Arthrobacter sp. 9MFCol3.1]|uniref:hypothetical protein n=1 Tax=Arthrobacter sp. 9MFCol3.1 TaxID=1150398 RepID=UPI0012DC8415|nr:hypothetical protein [Arthrobacter sp. 9MFCol3.1]
MPGTRLTTGALWLQRYRKADKQLRYVIDVATPVVGKPDRVLEQLPRRLGSLYDEAAWLPDAASLQYDPGTSAARTGSGI